MAPAAAAKQVYDRFTRPEVPRPGLVVRSDYLWKQQEAAWRSRNPNGPNPPGRKERTVVVVDVHEHPMFPGAYIVDVSPVTHSPPDSGRDDALLVPNEVKQDLGLDAAPNYLVAGEVNRFVWPHGVLPYKKAGQAPRRGSDGAPSRMEWNAGFLRKGFYRELMATMAALREGNALAIVPRSYGT